MRNAVMRSTLRIVSGSLRGRRLTCVVAPGLRPTPDRVRQALFNILQDVVPDREFYDVFAGTGIVGMEALSRQAASATFVERDFRQLAEIDQNLKQFDVAARARVVKADAYRWAERWRAPNEPVNVFVSPPFADYVQRGSDMAALVGRMQGALHPGSVLILQADRDQPFADLPNRAEWEERHYGRNILQIWVKGTPPSPPTAEP
jgi:16S rRNA (guanine966-N2)-methyltransferase